MADASNFAKLVPGFDFLQNLVKGAGAAMPAIGQWVAPTLNPEEIEKRIDELRTVQFWLEQNARMIGATIQALEVQRMTLSTLQTMNVQMGDLRDSLKIRMPELKPVKQAEPEPEPETQAATTSADDEEEKTAGAAAAAGIVDPMQWWGALTKQFTELATTAMKETAASDAARNLAGAMVKQFDVAGQSLRNVADAAAKASEAAKTSAVSKAATAPAEPAARAPARKRKPSAKAAPKS